MARKIDLEALCNEKGLRITEQRRVIARVLSEAEDHPDVEKVYERASAIDPGISIATVYRTVRLFEEAGILDRHDFGDGRARYEPAPEAHHDHLIDVETGKVHRIRRSRTRTAPEADRRAAGLPPGRSPDGAVRRRARPQGASLPTAATAAASASSDGADQPPTTRMRRIAPDRRRSTRRALALASLRRWLLARC